MRTILVIGHPNLSESIVNKAWLEAIRPYAGEELTIHTLTEVIREDFTFDLKAEQHLLQQHDRIILQFPLYWYMVPGIMKQWLDTVWASGYCYDEGGDKLEGKLIEVAVSCGAPEFCFDPNHPGGIAIEDYLIFLKGTAGFVRAKAGGIHAFFGAESPDYEERLRENTRAFVQFALRR